MTRNTQARIVMYADRCSPEVRADPRHPEVVVVSMVGLKAAFESAVDRYFKELPKNKDRGGLAMRRLEEMVQIIPYRPRAPTP